MLRFHQLSKLWAAKNASIVILGAISYGLEIALIKLIQFLRTLPKGYFMKLALITLSLMCSLFLNQAEARTHQAAEEYPVCMVEATFLDGTKMLLNVDCDGPFSVEGKCVQEVAGKDKEDSSWELVDCK